MEFRYVVIWSGGRKEFPIEECEDGKAFAANIAHAWNEKVRFVEEIREDGGDWYENEDNLYDPCTEEWRV